MAINGIVKSKFPRLSLSLLLLPKLDAILLGLGKRYHLLHIYKNLFAVHIRFDPYTTNIKPLLV